MSSSAQIAMKIAQKVRSARRIPVEERGCPNSVRAEDPERCSQLAPGCHDASLVQEAQLDRPNDALGKPRLLIGVLNGSPGPGTDRRTQDDKRYRVFGKLPAIGSGDRQWRIHGRPQVPR